jgi:hypothetical protein
VVSFGWAIQQLFLGDTDQPDVEGKEDTLHGGHTGLLDKKID